MCHDVGDEGYEAKVLNLGNKHNPSFQQLYNSEISATILSSSHVTQMVTCGSTYFPLSIYLLILSRRSDRYGAAASVIGRRGERPTAVRVYVRGCTDRPDTEGGAGD